MLGRYLFLFGLLAMGLQSLGQQTVVVSEPQKLSGKTPNSSILGKNNEGIIIYKYGRGNDVIESYSSNMALRWKKTLNIKQENSSILRMILFPTKTLAFFLTQSKNHSVVFAQKLSSKFTTDGKFLFVDSLQANHNNIANDLKVVNSQNRSQIAIYLPTFANGKITNIQVTGMNSELEVRYRTQIAIPNEANNYLLDGIVPDNNGNLIILLESKERTKKEVNEREFRAYFYNITSKLLTEIPFSLEKQLYGNIALEVDNINNRVDIAGFFSKYGRKEANGYFIESFDIVTQGLVTHAYTDFTSDMMSQITGKDSAHNDKGLYSFHIKELVLRHDGGAIILAESQFDNTENIEMPTFGPTVGPNVRTVKVNYYNDIMSLSLKPDGQLDWFNLLHKKQVSEDDDGFFSSFSVMTTDDLLHFVYNDEIYPKTNVEEYTVDNLGHEQRNMMFNSGDRDILLAPTLGKQISSNELIVPSFRKNSIRFVKITF